MIPNQHRISLTRMSLMQKINISFNGCDSECTSEAVKISELNQI